MNNLKIEIKGSLIDKKYSMDYDVQSRIIKNKKQKIYEQVKRTIDNITEIVNENVLNYDLIYNYIEVLNDECKAIYHLTYNNHCINRCINIVITEHGQDFYISVKIKDKTLVEQVLMVRNKPSVLNVMIAEMLEDYVELCKDLSIYNSFYF